MCASIEELFELTSRHHAGVANLTLWKLKVMMFRIVHVMCHAVCYFKLKVVRKIWRVEPMQPQPDAPAACQALQKFAFPKMHFPKIHVESHGLAVPACTQCHSALEASCSLQRFLAGTRIPGAVAVLVEL